MWCNFVHGFIHAHPINFRQKILPDSVTCSTTTAHFPSICSFPTCCIFLLLWNKLMDNDSPDPKPVFTWLMRSLVGAQPETKSFFEMFCTQVPLSSFQHLLYQCIRAHFSLKWTAAGSQINNSSTAWQTWQSDFSGHIPILKYSSLLCFTICKDTPKTDYLGNQVIEMSSLDYSVCIQIILHTVCKDGFKLSSRRAHLSFTTFLWGVTAFFFLQVHRSSAPTGLRRAA